MSTLRVVILAAGKGTRMKSDRPKVLHAIGGRTIIEHVLHTVSGLDAAETIVVVGHGAEAVKAGLEGVAGLQFVVQTPQLGTGHALLQTEGVLGGKRGTVLLLSGDVPLLQQTTLRNLLEKHRSRGAALTVLTTELADPYGYGRMVRDESGSIVRIVEERDASGEERAVREVNTGIYAMDLEPLFPALRSLASDNAQGEYYLTDLVRILRERGLTVEALCVEDASELRGVNSRVDLADVARVLRERKLREVMLAGTTLEDPATTYIDQDVTIGIDTILAPGVSLGGRTTVGARCRIHAGARITDSSIGDDVTVLDGCIIVDSRVAAGVSLGPYAHLRPGTDVMEGAHIGNFVELKKTRFGRGSKAGHLTYLGDAIVGDGVNVGAGTITCNYDGEKKQVTVIEDEVFVGSDSQLIAPVTIGTGAYVAAGSSVTEDVPPGALAISRVPQVNKAGWAAKRQDSRKKEESR